MVRKLAIMQFALVLICYQAGVALAINPDTGPGCGLGKIIWAESKHPKNILPQAFMALTNWTGMNPFAISTGTSGCTNDGVIWSQERANVFAAINFENLSQEMAQGQGEHLASLATLMGVPAEHQTEFFTLTQEKYTSLVRAGETSPAAMVKALNAAMAEHPVLAKATTAR